MPEALNDRKNISISVKRQVTIPQKYFDKLGFSDEAECILQDDCIILRPARHDEDNFAEQILADLISKNYSGEELLKAFRIESKKVRPAVRRMMDEADKLAVSNDGNVSLNDIFAGD